MADDIGPRPAFEARPLRDSRGRSWGYLGLIGAIGIAGLALLVGPNVLSPEASAPPSVAPSSDPHWVSGPLGTFAVSVDYTAVAIVVSRVSGSTVTEIGRQRFPRDQVFLASGEPVFGTYEWAMTCPGTMGSEIRIVFGSVFPANGVTYLGPPARWSVAPDGLFIAVLDPGYVDPGVPIRINGPSGGVTTDVGAFQYALDSGATLPSGCHTA